MHPRDRTPSLTLLRRTCLLGALTQAALGPCRALTAQQPAQNSSTAPDTTPRATITGIVRDEGGNPVPGALVLADSGLRRATTDSAGRFRLDNIRAGQTRAEVRGYGYAPLRFEFEIGSGLTVDVELTLRSEVAAGGVTVEGVDSLPASTGAGAIEGVVTASDGTPVAGVIVRSLSTDIETVTGPDGSFRVARVWPGLHVIRARKLGMLPEYIPLQIPTAFRVRLAVRMRSLGEVPQLAGVTIREDARLMGFYERRKRGVGIFLTRDDLEQKYIYEVSDALRGRRAVDLYRTSAVSDPVIVSRTRGGNCPLGILIDGQTIPWSDISLDRLVSVKNVRALEVYTAGRDVPLGFQRRETGCGAVLVWTR